MYEERSGPEPILFIKCGQTPRAEDLNLNLDITETATLLRLCEDIPNGIFTSNIIDNSFSKIVLLGAEAIKMIFKKTLKEYNGNIYNIDNIYFLCLNGLGRLYMSNLKKEKELLRRLCDI